ncbi:hypothetical protein FACS1894199_01200 [Bacteroidia bacterium]|nr:hypothetical protein FACS1894199_01200 [Bacteroidia bacterium]
MAANKNQGTWALNRAAALCSKREYCVRDVREKLAIWEVSEMEADKIIDFLIQHKFIDEQRFARFYVNDKLKFNKWGKIKIATMLKYKGIDVCTIKTALSQIDNNLYYDICTALLRQKKKTSKQTDSAKAKNSLIRFGLGRGFEYAVVKECMEN